MPNPPITIGELADVPAPGAPVYSPWAQEISNRVIQRFATVAARDAAWPAATAGNGAVCVVLAADVTGGMWEVHGGAWWRPWGVPWGQIAYGTYVSSAAINMAHVVTITLSVSPGPPAGRRLKIIGRNTFFGGTNPVTFAVEVKAYGATATTFAHTLASPYMNVPTVALLNSTGAVLTVTTEAWVVANGPSQFASSAAVPDWLLIEDIGPT